jgi:PAS domain S-box-containing protein
MELEEISASIKSVLCFDQGLLKILVNESPSAQVLVDREMRLLAVSESWCKEFGFERNIALGLTYYELLPEFPSRCREIHRRCLAGESLKCSRDRLVRNDGRVHWYRWDIGPWYNESRNIGGILIYLDIHTELENTLSDLHAALSAAEIGVWVRDLVTGKIEWSGQTEKIWGYRPGEFDGSITAFEERVHPDDLEALNQTLASAIISGRPYSQEFRIRWPDGSIHWDRARAVCEYGENKRALRLRGASVDITEIEETRQTLKRERDRLSEILSATTEAEKVAKIGTWSLSMSTGETHWSGGVFRIFNLPESQTPPPLSELESKYIHPEDIHVIHGMLEDIQKGSNHIDIEHRIMPTDGSMAWIRAVGKVSRDQHGNPIRLIGTVQDITASHQLLDVTSRSDRGLMSRPI